MFSNNQNSYNKSDSILQISSAACARNRIIGTLISWLDEGKIDSNRLAYRAVSDLKNPLNVNDRDKFYLRDHVVEEMLRIPEERFLRYLDYRYAYDIFPVSHELSDFPPVVQIEPTSICNYRCVFCYQTDNRLTAKKNGHMGKMSLSLFQGLIDQLEGNVDGVTLASRGEPTINKNLPFMLNYMGDKFLASKLNTNAYFLTEELCHSILSSGLQTLVFSADAAEEKAYARLRVNGSLGRVLDNIKRFSAIREKHYPNSKLITRVSGVKYEASQDFDEMNDFWGSLVDQVAFVDYNPWENVYDSSILDLKTPCSDLWRRMFVWWDGKVAPCDVDYLTTLMPNLTLENGESIAQVWAGEAYSKLRYEHLSNHRKLIEPCRRCSVC